MIELCGVIAPLTGDRAFDPFYTPPAIRCQLPKGHDDRHAATVEFTDDDWLELPDDFRLERRKVK